MANRNPFPYREKVTEAEGIESEELQDDGQEVSIDQGVLLDQGARVSLDRDLGRHRGDTDGTGEDAITDDFGGLCSRNELLYVPDPHLVPKSVKATSLDRALAYLDSISNHRPTGNYALQRFIQSPTVPSAHLAEPFSLNTAPTDQESRHEMDRPSDSSCSEPPEMIRSYSQPTYGINGQIVQLGNSNYLAKHNPVSPSLPSRSRLQLGNLQQQQLEASSMGRATQSLPGDLELEPRPGYGSKSERGSVTTGIGSSLDRLRALRQRSTNPSTNRSASNASREREEDEWLNDDLELLDFAPPITTSPKEVEFPIEDIINTWLVDNVSGTSSGRVNITPMQNHQFAPERSLLLDYPQNIIAPEGTAQNSGQAISSMSFSSSFLVAPPDSSASRPRELSQFTPPPSGMGYYSLEGLPRAPHIQYGLFPPPGVLHSHGIPTPISQSSFGVQNPYGIQTRMPHVQSSFAIGVRHPYDLQASGVPSSPEMIGRLPLPPLPPPQPQPRPPPGPPPGLMGDMHELSPRPLVPFSTELRLLPGVPIPSIRPSVTENPIAKKKKKDTRKSFQSQQYGSRKTSSSLSARPIVPPVPHIANIPERHITPYIPPSLPGGPILPSEPPSMIGQVAPSLPASQPPFPSGEYPRVWVPGARPRGDVQWQFSEPIIQNRTFPPGLQPYPQDIGQIIEIQNGQSSHLNESRAPSQHILPYPGAAPRLLEIQNTQSVGDDSPSNFQPSVNITPVLRPPPGLTLPRPGTGSPFLSLDPLLAHLQEIPTRPVETYFNSPETTENPNHGIIVNYRHPELHERGGVLMELRPQREGVTQRSTRNSVNRRTRLGPEFLEQTDLIRPPNNRLLRE